MLPRSNPQSINCSPAPGSLTQNNPGTQPRATPLYPQGPRRFIGNCQDAEWKAGHTWKEVGIQTRFRFSCFTLSAVETKAALVVFLSPHLIFLVVLTFAQIQQKRSNPSPH